MVNRALPDYGGFVFYEKSKRNVTDEMALKLRSLLDRRIKAVGVFVDCDQGRILSLLKSGAIDMVQLHGHEDNDYIKNLKNSTGAEIIKAFQIKDRSLKETGEIFKLMEESPADHILIDSGKGSGQVFDWSILKGIKRPFFLAGGLKPDNIEQALTEISPFGLDLSSGIETEGLKDEEKITAVMEIVRRKRY